MFKQQGGFWLYFFGIIIMFLVIFYIAETLMGKQPGASLFKPKAQVTAAPSITKVSSTGTAQQTSLPSTTSTVAVDYYGVIKTNKGEIKIELYEKNAPNTVSNFINLANSDYYNDTKFFKLIPGFVLQGGSKTNTNVGGPGYTIPDETNWDSLDYEEDLRIVLRQEGYRSIRKLASIPLDKYVLSMVGVRPNTAGSQFYVVLANKNDNRLLELRGRSTVFAKVIEGQQIIDMIGASSVDNSLGYASPVEDLIIQDINIFVR